MKPKQLSIEDRAVSPVVGVALLIAITVILAAVIGAVVLGLGTGGVDTPQAQLQAQFDDVDTTEESITLQHNGGEPLPADHITLVVESAEGDYDVDLADITTDGEDLTAGNSATIDGTNAFDDNDANIDETAEMTVIWDDPNSDSETVLETFEA